MLVVDHRTVAVVGTLGILGITNAMAATTGAITGAGRQVPRPDRRLHRQRQPAADLGLCLADRPTRPGRWPTTVRCRPRASAWTWPATPSRTAGRARLGLLRHGGHPEVDGDQTAPWSTPRPASASTSRTTPRPTAPSCRSGPAPAAPTRSGRRPVAARHQPADYHPADHRWAGRQGGRAVLLHRLGQPAQPDHGQERHRRQLVHDGVHAEQRQLRPEVGRQPRADRRRRPDRDQHHPGQRR